MASSYLIGPFRLDVAAEMLFRGTEPVALGQRAVALLRLLVERPGEPVSKERLLADAWPGVFVEEGNLAVQIAAVRRVLHAEPGGERWIETLPRRGYRFVGPVQIQEQGGAVSVSSTSDAAPELPNQPSIAVLPFQNMSGDPEQEYFADGMVEEITTSLSRFRSLFVIARNSSFAYKGRAVDVKQVGRELGVRYVLEGSVRKAGGRLRITGQLIDAATGAHLWADRVDGNLEDVFDLQDQVAESVVSAITARVERAEIDRSRRKPTESFDAYDTYLSGMASFNRPPLASRANVDDALRLFKRAIDLDGEFAAAHAMAGYCYLVRRGNGYTEDPVREAQEAARLVERAVELSRDDALAIGTRGAVLAWLVRDLDAGAGLIDRALALNRNYAVVWFFGGYAKLWLGEPEVANERFARAMRLSPVDPSMTRMQAAMADAHFHAERYEEAAAWAAAGLRDAPDHHNALRASAASNALAGHLEEAQRAVARLRQLQPLLSLANLHRWQGPYRRPEDRARYEDALRKAGLPE
jgi:TolB-like protein